MRISSSYAKAALKVALSVVALGLLTTCGDTKWSTPPDIDPAANPTDSRGVVQLIHRVSGNREALYVEITPGSGGGTFGRALHLRTNGQLVYARFLPFAEVIDGGNDFVNNGSLPRSANPEITSAETERTDPEVNGAGELQQQYTQGNILTLVAPNPLTGYHVDVFVDNTFIVQIYKDCNFCPMFTQSDAVARAQSYLALLQGWNRGSATLQGQVQCVYICKARSSLTGEWTLCGWGKSESCPQAELGARQGCRMTNWRLPYNCFQW